MVSFFFCFLKRQPRAGGESLPSRNRSVETQSLHSSENVLVLTSFKLFFWIRGLVILLHDQCKRFFFNYVFCLKKGLGTSQLNRKICFFKLQVFLQRTPPHKDMFFSLQVPSIPDLFSVPEFLRYKNFLNPKTSRKCTDLQGEAKKTTKAQNCWKVLLCRRSR